MSYVLIPLTSEPDQKIQEITIPVDGQNLRLGLRIRYNTVGNYWWMTISSRDGDVLIDSLPLVVGKYPAGDIFAPHKYMGLGSACVVNAGNAALDYPNDLTLGVDFFLLWGDTILSTPPLDIPSDVQPLDIPVQPLHYLQNFIANVGDGGTFAPSVELATTVPPFVPMWSVVDGAGVHTYTTGAISMIQSGAGDMQVSLGPASILDYVTGIDMEECGLKGTFTAMDLARLPNLSSLTVIYNDSNFKALFDLSDLPAGMMWFNLGGTISTITGNLSDLPAGMSNLVIWGTASAIMGGAITMMAHGLYYIALENTGMSQAAVDDVINRIYADRNLFTVATPTLNIGDGNAAPSGVFRAANPPTTALEKIYSLVNDNLEGFHNWTITYTNPDYYLLSDDFPGSTLNVAKWPTKIDTTSRIVVDTDSLHILGGKVGGSAEGEPGIFSGVFTASAGLTLQAKLLGTSTSNYGPFFGLSNKASVSNPAADSVYRIGLAGSNIRCGVASNNHDYPGLWTPNTYKWVRMVLTTTGCSFYHSNDGTNWTLLYTETLIGWPVNVYVYIWDWDQVDMRATEVRLG